MGAVRTVGIFSKPGAAAAHEVVPRLIAWLEERGIAVRLDRETAEYAGSKQGLDRMRVPDGCDLAVVLGGDGTLLSAARAVGDRAIPLLAVNLGGLGFLTAISSSDLFPQLELALTGPHKFTRRRMLTVTHWREGRACAAYRGA